MTTTRLRSLIEQWLRASQLRAGERLPPERELARQFGVTRAELRKAMAIIEKEGQVERHVGRGTFIADGADIARAADQDVADRTSPLAAMEARSVVEPELARLASLNGTSAQFAEMRALCAQMRDALSWDDYAELDWRFHNLVAEATGNVLLVEIQRVLNGVRRYVVWGNLVVRAAKPSPDYHSFAEHEAIIDAIASRDPARATREMLAHLERTRADLMAHRSAKDVMPAT